jgi:hypothetical protein
MGSYSDEVRERVRGLAEKESLRGLDLAWHLGEIETKKLYLSWSDQAGNPIGSQNAYWQADLRGHVSRSHFYSLSSVGQVWQSRKPLIERLVKESRTGIAELIEVTVAVKNGVPFDKALRYLEFGEPYMEGLDGGKKGAIGGFVKVELYVEEAKLEDFWRGAYLNAVRCQISSPEQSLVELAIQESLDPLLPKRFEKYRDLINEGKFACRKCGLIPEHPTDHHIFPQSLYQGWGPTVILCEAPCHPEVQVRWLDYANSWYGKAWVEQQRKEMQINLGREIRWSEVA